MTSSSKSLKSLSATATAALTCTAVASAGTTAATGLKHQRRYCHTAGCTRIVKSQGLCQRHGAKPCKCRVEACEKQAQGNFDGMCKSHFRALQTRETTQLSPKPDETESTEPAAPTGESVYHRIIPTSLSWNPVTSIDKIPLVSHLEQGAPKPLAWHRNEERAARGLWLVHHPATQLERWEHELVWAEILILTGLPDSSFRHLAHGWGRHVGFHLVLARYIFGRHGADEREKRERANVASAASSFNADGTKRRRINNVPSDGDCVAGADVWDDEWCYYGDANHSEALFAGLLDLHDEDGSASFTFDEEDELIVTSSAGDDQDASSDTNSEAETAEV